ncbi:MAG: cob(I)yrinic acid a,c-diamide adenosyltransferase [Lewinellaceae bacterium]|nr:cob(I)yrinic acid a,c-diamide adenosyltransferase [Lewinellaceae bacterium]
MKIYTKQGDKGMTSLIGGRRISKHDVRIEAYGTIDELNSHIGLLLVHIENKNICNSLFEIQNRLFDIGSTLACDPQKSMSVPQIDNEDINFLEILIDQMEETLPLLKNFILPGGNLPSAQAHVCRTVCRRAERRVTALEDEGASAQLIVQYLNRLSDYLFVLSRFISNEMGMSDVIWSGKSSK